MNYKLLLTVVIIFFFNSFFATNAQRRKKILPPCHFKAVETCYAPLFYFSHRADTTGLALDRRDHAVLCRSLRNVTGCLSDFFGNCGSSIPLEIFDLISESYIHKVRNFCKRGPIKNNYLAHAQCINDVRLTSQFKSKCVNRFQATLESVDNSFDIDDRVGVSCCAYKFILDCSSKLILKQCNSEDAVKAYIDYVTSLTGGIADLFCKSRKFSVSSRYCKNSLTPPRITAKGKNSKSPLTLGDSD